MRKTDIAIVKIDGKNLPSAKLGDSDTIRVGQWAIAIGNPFGLSQTVSIGVISATGRANVGVAAYEDMIQTDAAINPGNSGGPLVNIKGEIIGINTAIFTRSGGYQGIGFAIPINMVKIIMKDLVEKGKVTRGWLGVVIQDIDPALAKSFNVTVTEGVLVSDIQDNSPAKEDIRPLQVAILNLMPTKVATETQLLRLLSNSALQVEVTLLHTATYESKNVDADHLLQHYVTFDEIKSEKFDGLIITGAPVEQMPFEEVDYWPEHTHILDWAETNVESNFYICWGAQAALYHRYGIPKYDLPRKMFGVFEHRILPPAIGAEPLLRGFDDIFLAPHSRPTEIRRKDIDKINEIQILAESLIAIAAPSDEVGDESGTESVGMDAFEDIIEVIPVVVLHGIRGIIAGGDRGLEHVMVDEWRIAPGGGAGGAPNTFFSHDSGELHNGESLLRARAHVEFDFFSGRHLREQPNRIAQPEEWFALDGEMTTRRGDAEIGGLRCRGHGQRSQGGGDYQQSIRETAVYDFVFLSGWVAWIEDEGVFMCYGRAGCQHSDPKPGPPFPLATTHAVAKGGAPYSGSGFAPQGDAIRGLNFARLVRNGK